MQNIDAKKLIKRYREGNSTPAEKAILEDWLLFGQFKHPDLSVADLETDIKLLDRGFAFNSTKKLWPLIAAAACLLLCLSIGSYFVLQQSPGQQLAYLRKHDVAPALTQATLTLANGRVILLNKSLRGTLAMQGSTLVAVGSNKGINYSVQGSQVNTISYNTLSTARGEQSPFPLQLSDGTKVWLNAASSITFPVAFTGNERRVAITGEAYFEVVHNDAKPFRVSVNGQTIEDIGTSFNINAYPDELSVKTTLLEGSVEINNAGSKAILTPGQQAETLTGNKSIKIKNIDTEASIAWKNGYFLFDHESLQSVMRKISRWYNVDVQYASNQQPNVNYFGSMPRDSNLSVVLNMLQITGNVKFKVDGKKITAIKK